MDIEKYKNRVKLLRVNDVVKSLNISNILCIDTAKDNIRGFRATQIFVREEEVFEYKMLYKYSRKFRKYVHMSKYSKSKRVRNKYSNKIDRDIKWLNNLIKNDERKETNKCNTSEGNKG